MVAPSSESKIPQKRLDPSIDLTAATDKRKLHLRQRSRAEWRRADDACVYTLRGTGCCYLMLQNA